MSNIMIIEDDVYIGELLEEMLREQGYGVSRAYSGTEALLLLRERRPDLILLDLMLPGLDGEGVLSQITGIPVIVVSAKADVEDKVKLVSGGAVDYITKPFDNRELLARVAVQLLMQNSSRVITRNAILDRISRDTPDGGESSLKVHISNLRRKLKDAGERDYIEAVWGIGFKMRHFGEILQS